MALREFRAQRPRIRTLRAVGEAVGVSAQTIGNWEAGPPSPPSFSHRCLLARLLGREELRERGAWLSDAEIQKGHRRRTEAEARVDRARVSLLAVGAP